MQPAFASTQALTEGHEGKEHDDQAGGKAGGLHVSSLRGRRHPRFAVAAGGARMACAAAPPLAAAARSSAGRASSARLHARTCMGRPTLVNTRSCSESSLTALCLGLPRAHLHVQRERSLPPPPRTHWQAQSAAAGRRSGACSGRGGGVAALTSAPPPTR